MSGAGAAGAFNDQLAGSKNLPFDLIIVKPRHLDRYRVKFNKNLLLNSLPKSTLFMAVQTAVCGSAGGLGSCFELGQLF